MHCFPLTAFVLLLFSSTIAFTASFSVASFSSTTPPNPSTPQDTCSSNSNINNNNNNLMTMSGSAANAKNTITKLRAVKKVLPKPSAHWVGDGFRVYPVFADYAFTEELSPLLMFDYAEPRRFPAKLGAPLGVGQHPHRGFETVTVAFQGEVEHHDSTGNTGIIKAGDVQWMTAARGIIHQEYHSKEFTRQGGTFEMCQLWVNLPKKYKMTKPGYQAILKDKIPVVSLPLPQDNTSTTESDESATMSLGSARIIAGELGNTKGAASTFSPVQMWDVSLPHAGSEVDLPFPVHHNCIIFVRRGRVEIVSSSGTSGTDHDNLRTTPLGPQDVALMKLPNNNEDVSAAANTIRIRVVEPDSSIMVLGGEPLNEPIAAQGPFVMNTHDELRQAFSDYRMGKMGR